MSKLVTVWIDGKELQVEEGMGMLEAALSNGIYIPHLCHHPDLPELGSCRLCLVQEEGKRDIVPSCTMKARDGLKIVTNNEEIKKHRNLAMELILAAHPEDCTTCPKYGRCEFQTLIQYLGVTPTRMRMRAKAIPKKENPLIIHDMLRCVLCGRCVRACKDMRGVNVLTYQKDELETYVGTIHKKLLKDEDCRFCGACAEVCPTGSIMDAMNYTPIEKKDTLIPCKSECPVHTDIPRYIRLVKEGKYAEATAVIHEKLPFPESLGRVCSHVCEAKCRRGEVNEPISIRNIKRYAAEHDNNKLWLANSKRLPATGKKVAVIGAGPAGMTAALYLAKQGHDVIVKEMYPKTGGQMRYGIPVYRLPDDVIDRESSYLEEFGVKIETNCKVDRPVDLVGEYDAVLVAVGTHAGVRLPIPGNDLDGVKINTDFLRDAAMGLDTGIEGKRVIVLGGGNVAFDCARSAKRLGAKEIHLACLEAREVMTADDEEIEQAQEEGIFVHPAQSFERITGDENGNVTGVDFMNVLRFYFDENRRAVTEKEEGSEHHIDSDIVIFATGQRTNLPEDCGLERGRANSIATVDGAATSVEGVFACGDAVYGTKTVIMAVAAGRDAASQIDKYLGGDGDISEVLYEEPYVEKNIGKIEGFSRLERKEEQFLPVAQRDHDMREISKGICDADICGESERCLQCDLRFTITPARIWSDFSDKEEKANA